MQEKISDIINLENLIPRMGSFKLKSTGKTYKLRPIDLDDQVWFGEKYPQGEGFLKDVFNRMDAKVISEIVYHQLDIESKKQFLSKEVEYVDDDTGVVATKRLTGPEVFRRSVAVGKEFIEVFKALSKTMGLSQPIIDAMEIKNIKKKSPAVE